MTIAAVVFDVGETLIDETNVWSAWADWLGVPRFTFMATLGGVIERGEHHTAVFDAFRPGFDLDRAFAERRAAGHLKPFTVDDVYADVRACFDELQTAGYRLAIAGNQPAAAEAVVRELKLSVELVAASERWGVEKPSPAFFERLSAELRLEPRQIAYVGDRIDNDVIPANAAGMISVFLLRGPWAYIQGRRPEADAADISIGSLAELPRALASWRASTGTEENIR